MSGEDSNGAFSVSGFRDGLTVNVLGYENSRPATVSDANWLRAHIQLETRGCVVRVDAALTTQDVKYFLDELEVVHSALDGTASLTTDEEAISLRVKVTKTGAAQISGELKELGSSNFKLEFEFESDQSYLWRTLAGLRGIHQMYPIVDSV